MRNAFVVLVSLCIGLVSGFIVPTGVPEHTSEKNRTTDEKNRTVEVKPITPPTKFTVLPKSRKYIDENDLYEHATEKNNNQSERAFIYIINHKKYKKRNKIINMPSMVLNHNHEKPTAASSVPQTLSTFDSRKNLNLHFQGLDFSDKQLQEMRSNFEPPHIFRFNYNDKTKKNKETEKATTQVQTSNKENERRDHFELLKPPILRPVNRGNNKANYDGVLPNEFPSLAPLSVKDTFLKKHNLKNQLLSKLKAIERQDARQKNYGFNSPYILQPHFRSEELAKTVENVNFEGDFINEDFIGEDKLMDKYLKDTLEEQLPNSHDIHRNPLRNEDPNECSYRECILQSNKLYTNNGLLIRPDCKCGRRLNIKQADPFHAKERALREESKRNVTRVQSAEVNYEELLTDDSSMIKLDISDYVVRPPRKFSETALH